MSATWVGGNAMPPQMPSETSQPTNAGHISVLLQEAVDALQPRPGGVYVDGTFGAGGHSRLIAQRISPDGRLLCIDRDPATRVYAETLQAPDDVLVEFIEGTYADLSGILAERRIGGIDGMLLDLGLSSMQLDDPARGFSFRVDGPLDMRFDTTSGRSAAEFLALASEEEIARVLWNYGEERQSRRIGRAIVRERGRLETTGQLAALVEDAVGGRRGERLHPATRTFQALRIAVNDELSAVAQGVAAGLGVLLPGGRFVVIAFHSLEDRIVKQAFVAAARGCICPRDQPICTCGQVATVRLVGKALRPSAAEVATNPRARSAIMRVVERLGAP